jgi:quercetin dioxygenase-like cupin family protein
MATVKSPDRGSWMPMPDLFPKGAEMQVLIGDPAKGAADFYFRVPAQYPFPWHFPTSVERLFVDQGTLEYEMRGGKKETLGAGDYVYVPARSPHRVACTSSMECRFFLSSNGQFDVHLVDSANWTTTKSWRAGEQATATGTAGSKD